MTLLLVINHLSSESLHNEQELLEQVAVGDETAFAALVKLILPILQAIVQRIVKEEDPTREILQESLLRIWISRDKLPGLEKPLPWLKRVALNETFTWLNKNAHRTKIFADLNHDYPAAESTVFDKLSLNETQKIIEEAIKLLPAQRKRIYTLSRIEGLKPDEIATKLNLSTGYVKNALTAALESLRVHLRKAGKMLFVILHSLMVLIGYSLVALFLNLSIF